MVWFVVALPGWTGPLGIGIVRVTRIDETGTTVVRQLLLARFNALLDIGLNYRLPLAGAKEAAAKLSHATIISIPGIGHFVSPNSPCAQRVIVSFLGDPAAPDASCVAGLTPQTFAAPESP